MVISFLCSYAPVIVFAEYNSWTILCSLDGRSGEEDLDLGLAILKPGSWHDGYLEWGGREQVSVWAPRPGMKNGGSHKKLATPEGVEPPTLRSEV